MTDVTNTARRTDAECAARRSGGRTAALASRLAPWAAVAALALLTHPYLGLHHDARIYVGRAIADLDPAGVGRDLMYAGDGQSAFSLFPRLLKPLVAVLGAVTAAAVVSLGALALWSAAAAVFLGAWAHPRLRLATLAAVLVLPSAYGGFALTYGEAMAVPRPFAEALTLLAFWAMLKTRYGAAAMLLAAATAVHPIMALPGWAVLIVTLGLKDRRWFVAAVSAGLLAGLAALLHLPVARRLLQPVDAQWMRVLAFRSPYLFLHLWPADRWGRLAVQATTLALGAVATRGRARVLLLATAGVAAAALGATALLCDTGASLLAVQLQPWRALWPAALMAAACLPLVVASQSGQGAAGRLSAGFLLLAWTGLGDLAVALPCSVLAILSFVAARRGAALSPATARLAWALLLGVAAMMLGGQALALGRYWAMSPSSARPDLRGLAERAEPLRVLLVGAALAVALQPEGRLRWWSVAMTPAMRAGLAAAALVVGLLAWDVRDSDRRLVEDAQAAREVRALVAARPGAVAWPEGDVQPALLAGRASWWTRMQGASSVFSRPQALEWMRRGRLLVDTGVASPDLFAPFGHVGAPATWKPSPTGLLAVCAEADAPAWIVAAAPDTQAAAYRAAGAVLWRAPRDVTYVDDQDRPIAIRRYAFFPCGRA